MSDVVLARRAVENLDRLTGIYSLPADTRKRVESTLRPLESFPELGRELGGSWAGHRFLLGPWRWMVFVYRVDEARDRVVAVTIQDARTSSAATADPR